MKPEFSRSWTDAFGTALIHLEGRTGEQTILLLCPLEHGQQVLDSLETRPSFKGRITLAVFEKLHTSPVQAVLRFLEPKIVLALDAETLTSSGDALHIELEKHQTSTGLEYLHGGDFPAWKSELKTGAHGSSVLASIAAQHAKVLACHPNDLLAILEQGI